MDTTAISGLGASDRDRESGGPPLPGRRPGPGVRRPAPREDVAFERSDPRASAAVMLRRRIVAAVERRLGARCPDGPHGLPEPDDGSPLAWAERTLMRIGRLAALARRDRPAETVADALVAGTTDGAIEGLEVLEAVGELDDANLAFVAEALTRFHRRLREQLG